MLIIGITGLNGAGKGTVVEYLLQHYGFQHKSVREFLERELTDRNLPINRDMMTELANELRTKRGAGFIVEQLYNEAELNGANTVIESIRNVGEIKLLNMLTGGDENFWLLGVTATPEIRYSRVTNRKSSTDLVSFQKFCEDEKREMTSSDPNKQNLSACIARADLTFINNGTIDELHAQVDKFMRNKLAKAVP